MKRIFVDGSSGTTGLRIRERLSLMQDVHVTELTEAMRKDPAERRKALNSADIAVLCLPDEAAREAVEMTDNPDTVVIDASSAHRTAPGWVYGFPEAFPGREEEIAQSRRISVPGCHASGFTALVAPLVRAGVLLSTAVLPVYSLTGYSGGGKKMIREYEDAGRNRLLSAPCPYALGQEHKHLPEMKVQCGLQFEPVFSPIVGDFYSGMLTSVLLSRDMLSYGAEVEDIRKVYAETYRGETVSYVPELAAQSRLSAAALSGLDCMKITVCGNPDRIQLAALFDNLGKGASGAAVQCINIVCGADPARGLLL